MKTLLYTYINLANFGLNSGFIPNSPAPALTRMGYSLFSYSSSRHTHISSHPFLLTRNLSKGISKKSSVSGLRSKNFELSVKNLNTTYWNPGHTSNSFTLNDYQYIKCKWLFELLIGGLAPIHKDYGYIARQRGNGSLIRKDELGITRFYTSNWTNELLGEYSRIYYSTIGPTKSNPSGRSRHGTRV
jgi:hypothetical protein